MPESFDPYYGANQGLRSLREIVATMQQVAAAMTESMGAQRLPGSGNFAFRFMSPVPILVPPGPADAEPTRLPEGYFDEGGPGYQATSYLVVNTNSCWVRLAGSATDADPVVAPYIGRPFPPNFIGVFTTLKPKSMRALPFARPSIPIPDELFPLEVFYGGGA